MEQLGLSWDVKIYATADLKTEHFLKNVSPNGFAPVIEDPNTGVKIWESGAINTYLLETYDKENSLTFPASEVQKRAEVSQWSFFQATAQGPHLSAALYFGRFNPNAEAKKRYINESIRVLDVLERSLKTVEGSEKWLVGGKMTAADLAFLPYTWSMPVSLS